MNPELKTQIEWAVKACEGWCSPAKAWALAELILQHQPEVCVELGVFAGRSLVAQAMALREVNKGGHIYGIDPWCNAAAMEGETDPSAKEWWGRHVDLGKMHDQCSDTIRRLGLDPWTTLIRNRSQHVPKLFPAVGLLHIDGSHSEVASLRDVTLYTPMVLFGGHIVFDDADYPGVRKAVAFLNERFKYVLTIESARVYRNDP